MNDDSISLDEWLEHCERESKKLKWRLYRFFRGIYDFFRYDLHQGVYGLYYWFKFAWTWRPWDFQYGLTALEMHLRKLEPCVRNGYHENGKEKADNIAEAIRLLERYREDPDATDMVRKKMTVKQYIRQRDQEWKKLFKLMRDDMHSWWD